MNALIIVVAATVAGFLAFSRRLSGSDTWAATVTPLASIMGSGFLVSAPLLATIVGTYALPSMALLLVLAYGVGSAIRFNIRHFEPIENQGRGPLQDLGFLSRVVLAGAYLVSITYYLQLLAAFLTQALGVTAADAAPWVTTTLLVIIGGFGMWRGLAQLEAIEKYAVSLNLGMIAALLVALFIYNARLVFAGEWGEPPVDSSLDGSDLRALLGLLIVVQGFETSRYLGEEHPAELRIRTMRYAQLLSAAIYLLFIGLTTVLFRADLGAEVTAIIQMTAPIAAVLPILLTTAAIGSQFSAAVADNEGAGGLIEDITIGKLPPRYAYLLILCLTLALTWETDVNQIIAYASRAFALYYCLQCALALGLAMQSHAVPRRSLRMALFAALSVLCLAVFLFGVPAE